MLRDTKNYCDQARILANGGIIRTVVQHPWMENMKYDSSRVRVVNFLDNAPGEQHGQAGNCFFNARDLNAHLSALAQEPGPQNKRLILIEGLEPRMLEVVGVKFGIPPSFFLSHCDEFTDINIVDRACAKQSNPAYWRVPIPQVRHMNTKALEDKFGEDCYGCWDAITGNVKRSSFEIQPWVDRVEFRNFVSYWGAKSPNNGQGSSWTGKLPSTRSFLLGCQEVPAHSCQYLIAIVLIDPRLTKIQRQQTSCSSEGQEVQLFDLEDFLIPHNLVSEAIVWNEPLSSDQETCVGVPAWSVPTTHRSHRESLFDGTTNYFRDYGLQPPHDDPISSTVYIRNFVRSAWEEAIWRLDSKLLDEIVYDNRNIEDQRKRGLLNGDNVVKSYHDWKRETFRIKDSRQRVRKIMRAFNFSNEAYQKQCPDGPSSSPESESMNLEYRSWVLILEKLEMTEQDFRDHMDMFSQRAALLQALEAEKQTEEAGRQTNEANRMARSSGQLTKIATVIVPCSFVASIFSLGDEFAIGQRLFFVYWVISMPVTFALLIWVLYGDKVTDAWSVTKAQRAQEALGGSKWAMLRPFLSNLRSPQGKGVGQKDTSTEV